MIQLLLTLKMTAAQVVEMSVTVNNNSPIQDFVHPDDQTQPTFGTTFCKLKKEFLIKSSFLLLGVQKLGCLQGQLNDALFRLRVRAIFVWPLKLVSVSIRYLFHQPVNEKIKTWTVCFPAKENCNMENVLFDWPIVLQYNVKPKYRLFSRNFSGIKFPHSSVRLTNQKPRAFVSVRQTNQIAQFPFVCCFCFVRAFSFKVIRKSL